VESPGGDQQRAGGVEVGVAGGLGVGDPPRGPARGQKAVGALEVPLRPAPDPLEQALVAKRGADQHPLRLAGADRVAALIQAHDPPVARDVAGEEAGGRGAGGGGKRGLPRRGAT